MCKFIIYVLFAFVISTMQAQEESINNTSIDFKMSYFEDVYSVYSFETVQQEKFIPTKQKIVNLGISKSALWIKINLNSKVLGPEMILEVKTPLKDSITFIYRLKNDTIVRQSLGVMFPYSKNKFKHYLPAFTIPINDLASPVIYLKVKSRYSLFVPITIKSKETFYNERVNSYLVGGLLIGGLLLMGLYNLFLFFMTRDSSYLLYVTALFSAILSQGYLFGILIPYLSPESPVFSFRFPIVIMSITGIFSSLFAIRFLSIKENSKLFYSLLLLAILFSLFNIVIELMAFDYLSRKINIILVIGTSIIIFSSALYSLIKRNKNAIYFTIAWAFYLFGMITFALKTVGILPHNSFTNHFMHVGTFMEVLLLSFALGHKYYLIRIDKEKLEKQTKEELEFLVKKQTADIETSLREKEILLKEVHHRVKNNLQIVISLLDLQVASIKNPKDRDVLAQSKSRVYSMSLIHQKLYQSNNLASVNMKDYLEELFIYVQSSFFDVKQKNDVTLLIDNKELSLTKAVPLGLIVNELLTNSFKYSQQDSKVNKLRMSLAFSKNILILEISDSGYGFDETEKKEGIRKTLGLFLVKSLTKQLRGTIKRFYDNNMFVTQIKVPLDDSER